MSTTKNLGLFKHDNPETNTEKFDIENYLNGNWDKIDENVGEFNTEISNINSKNTELEKELKEAQEDFYQNSIRGQASGEYIHVEDSSNCRAKIGIGGNSEQETRSGKNKLNSASIGVGTNNGITCTYDSKTGIITFNGACNTDNTCFTFKNTSIPFTNNLTKMLVYYVSGSITTYCSFRTFSSNWSAGEILNLLDLSSSKNKTRIISSNTTIKKNIDIKFNNGSVANNFKIKLMITDSENDEYEQYGAMPSPDYPSEVESCGDNGSINEVICNKNICNFGSIQNSNIGLTNNLDKNVWKISGTSNANGYTTVFGRTSLGKFKAGTYSFSWKYSGTLTYASGGDTSISLLNKSLSKIIMDKALNTENKYSKFILTEDTEIALGFWNIGSGNVYSLEIECQLELSETNTEIVEHQSQTYTIPTQQPFRAIGDTRDTFIKKNNKWYERHYIDRKIFDGNEGITINTKNTESTLFQLVCTDCFVPTNLDKIYAKSNQLKGTSVNLCISEITGKNTVALGHNTNRLWLRVSSEIVGTGTDTERLTQLKSWLEEQYNAGTPVYVDYVLEEPLDIECTEEQSKILDELNNARTYKNVTNIYSTDEISPILDLDYAKDLETLLTSKESEV